MVSAWRSGRAGKLAGVALVIGSLLVSGARLSSGADLEKELVIVATGGTFEAGLKKWFYEPFEKATGVKVISVTANSLDQFTKLRAMLQTGYVEYDIVSGGPASAYQFRDTIVNIDCARLTNLSQALPGSCDRYMLLRTFGGGVIAYNTRAFPGGGPQSYADFWDVKRFPGPRAINNSGSPQWVLAMALLADGVPPDRLFPMDLDRAFRKMDEIKPHVRVWWKSGDQSQQILRDGEVVMSFMWSGRANTLRSQGLPIEVVWSQAIKDYATWSIARHAPHPNAAYAFLNFFLGNPRAHVEFGKQIGGDTSNAEAVKLIPPADRPRYGSTYWDKMIDVDGNAWVQENRAMIVERWNAWLAQ